MLVYDLPGGVVDAGDGARLGLPFELLGGGSNVAGDGARYDFGDGARLTLGLEDGASSVFSSPPLLLIPGIATPPRPNTG